ncbi:RNA polymerase sigma-32 factor [Granulibacter bethesdensis]|uniref:RNA polymerase sigma factor RpoH n=1 Tax=Granulibacter bethesdensis TaxID=364410 RepID=A0AAN0VFL6_9PROT|nr:RNA polymerase sigma-32 factor [Granulibacter bethesdensis]
MVLYLFHTDTVLWGAPPCRPVVFIIASCRDDEATIRSSGHPFRSILRNRCAFCALSWAGHSTSPDERSLSVASAVIKIAPEGNLSRYLQEIRKYPMLTPEEELDLSRRWRDTEDMGAAHRLVTSHLRLVAKIAMGYRGYGLPVGELISEGNVGMMQAVRRFDPDRGFRLATYAMWWIRAAIQEYILHSWSLVKMGTTAAQKKLFFNLRRLKGQMQAIDDGDLKPEQVSKIATSLNVPEQDVVQMNRRMSAPDHSLNAPLRQEGEGEWQDWLVDDAETQETVLADTEELGGRKTLLANALKTLNDRERHILTERRLKDEPTTLEDLSQHYNISRERVRQIEVRAFEKLQKAMKAEVIEQRRIADQKVEDYQRASAA